MPSMSVVIIIICVYLVAATLDYGMMLAALQRRNMEHCDELFPFHIRSAALVAFFGPFTLLGVILTCEPWCYGMKFYKGEIKLTKKWYVIYLETRKYERKQKMEERKNERIIDIWED